MASFSRPLLRSARLATLRASPSLRVPLARSYASAAPSSSGKGRVLGLVAAAVLGGGAFYAYSSQQADDPTKVKDAASPQQVNYQA